MRLDGRNAVVTGGASGIGRAIVQRLAESGARVFCGDVDEAGGARVAVDAGTQGGVVEALPLDVIDDRAIVAFADTVLARANRIDILINAVGGGEIAPFLESPPESWRRLVDLNFLGPVKVTRAFLAGGMVAAGHGKIVNIASDAGRVGSSGETVYAGAKGGIIAFTKSLAREMARHHINVNCVCPGPTDTPLLASRPEKLRAALIRAIPLHRVAAPDEIAEAAMFFAGPKADYLTGQVLSVSGGLTMVD